MTVEPKAHDPMPSLDRLRFRVDYLERTIKARWRHRHCETDRTLMQQALAHVDYEIDLLDNTITEGARE